MEELVRANCPSEEERFTCTSISAQYADVSLPVKLRPYATLGKVDAECCGEPVVSVRQTSGREGSCGGCEIIITQTLCLRIPVEYGATAEGGEVTVGCRRSSNCCTPQSSCR